MQAVQLREISLRYDKEIVLNGVDLSVGEGQYVVILGASGCGKTSLLRLIAGLISPTSGTISIGGRDVRGIAPRHRDVALVPQQAGLYPHLTIGRSIGMGIDQRVSRADRERRVVEAARVVELESVLDRFPDQLSGGQLRRAAVAKAIASRASVRLLDEPLSAIDANLRYQIERDLTRLHEQIPGSTIHVTHDGGEAIRIADQIAVIEDGKIVQFGPPDELSTHPVTPGVAAALGRSPLVTLRMRCRDSQWTSAGGQFVDGPAATEGAVATLGYYQADTLPLNESQSQRSGDWVDSATGVVVRQEHLFWFLDR